MCVGRLSWLSTAKTRATRQVAMQQEVVLLNQILHCWPIWARRRKHVLEQLPPLPFVKTGILVYAWGDQVLGHVKVGFPVKGLSPNSDSSRSLPCLNKDASRQLTWNPPEGGYCLPGPPAPQ